MVNLILDGCDCVGKSSIAEELLLTGRFEFIIKRRNPKNMREGRKEYINDVNILNTRDRLIFDRGMLGECVYAPIKRGYYPEYMRELESKLSDNTHLFLIYADLEIVKKRFDHEFIREDQLEKVIDMYFNEFEACNYKKKYGISTTKRTPKEASDLICDIIDNNDKYGIGDLL